MIHGLDHPPLFRSTTRGYELHMIKLLTMRRCGCVMRKGANIAIPNPSPINPMTTPVYKLHRAVKTLERRASISLHPLHLETLHCLREPVVLESSCRAGILLHDVHSAQGRRQGGK